MQRYENNPNNKEIFLFFSIIKNELVKNTTNSGLSFILHIHVYIHNTFIS